MFEGVSVERKTSKSFDVGEKNGFAGSKFWVGSSSDVSSGSGSRKKKKKTSPRKK